MKDTEPTTYLVIAQVFVTADSVREAEAQTRRQLEPLAIPAIIAVVPEDEIGDGFALCKRVVTGPTD